MSGRLPSETKRYFTFTFYVIVILNDNRLNLMNSGDMIAAHRFERNDMAFKINREISIHCHLSWAFSPARDPHDRWPFNQMTFNHDSAFNHFAC